MDIKVDRSNIKRLMLLTGVQKRLLKATSSKGQFGRIKVKCRFRIDYNQLCITVDRTIAHHDVLQSVTYDKNPEKIVQIILFSSLEKFIEQIDSEENIPLNLNKRSWKIFVNEEEDEIFFVWHQTMFDLSSAMNILNVLFSFYFSLESLARVNDKAYEQYFVNHVQNVERGCRIFKDKYLSVENSVIRSRSAGGLHEHKFSEWQYMKYSGSFQELNETILCTWGTILQSITNHQTVLLGVSNNQRGIERQAVGNFTNMIPVLFTCEGDHLISDIKEQVYQSVFSQENQQIDAYDISQYMNEDFRFQSALIIQDDTLLTEIQSKFPVNIYGPDAEYYSTQCPADIILQVVRKNASEVSYRFLWQEHLFSNAEISAFFLMVAEAFHQILNAQQLQIKDLQFKEIVRSNQGELFDNLEGEMFYLDTKRFSQDEMRTAVIYGEEKYSYGWFTKRVNQIANFLIHNVYQKEKPVVVLLMERSVEMLLVVHAVLKSGGVYLPIDPDSPEERIKIIVEDSGSELLITNTEYRENSIKVLTAESLLLHSENDSELLDISIKGDDIAYIIYTSGSTGKPKGVMISHRAIYNRLLWIKEYCDITDSDTLILKTPYTFDVSLIELLLWPLCGCSIYVLKEGEHRDPQAIMKAISVNGVSIVHFVPSMLKAFVHYFKDKQSRHLNSLRYIFSSGESLNEQHVSDFNYNFNENGRIKILNLYGPTEAAVDVSYYECKVKESDPIPIGTAIQNVRLNSIDLFERILPPGIKGQLIISGIALAKGYLNQPELTEEKFTFHPTLNERIYKTGDRVYSKDSGEFIFCGRMDRQVKLRGYRIELDEVKNAILQLPEIKDAETVLKKDDGHGEGELIAFIVQDPGAGNVSIDSIKQKLNEKLLSYMVPERFLCLEQLPVNASGKTDAKKLLQMDLTSIPDEVAVTGETETETETQIKLYDLWCRVLGKASLEFEKNFFAIGGDSLKAIYLVAEMNALFGCDWDINKVFSYPTIEQQVRALENEQFNERLPQKKNTTLLRRDKKYVVNATQRRLFFLSNLNNNKAYNITGVYKMTGHAEKNQIEEVFNLILEQHDILRTSYHIEGQDVVAVVHDNCQITIEEHSIEHEATLQHTIDSLSHGFNMEQPVLLRLYLISAVDTGSKHFVIDISHVIADGISLSILLRSFNLMFSGVGDKLPDENQYPIISRKSEEVYSEQKKYWLNELQSLPDSVPLKTDYPRPQVFTFNGNSIGQEYDKMDVDHCARLYGTTPSTVLLSALSILIYRQSGYKDFVIGVVVSGRTGKDSLDTIGPMINTLPLYISLKENMTGEEVIRYVHSKLLALLKNQDCPVEEIIDQLQLDRKLDQNPLFNVLYTFNNADIDLEMDINMDKAEFKYVPYKPNAAKVDLSIFIFENMKTVEFEYCTDLFEKESINKYMVRYQYILQKLGRDESKLPLNQWELLMDREKAILCYNSEPSYGDIDTDPLTTIQHQFTDIVQKYPERTAIQFGEQQLSYKELDYYSNCAAALLKSKGTISKSKIGIMLDNTPELIISILAVLKLGATYVPIDISTPVDRLNFIIENSNLDHMIMNIVNTIDFKSVIPASAITNPTVGGISTINGDLEDICYVIYTSGSTGTPKACLLKQESVVNYIKWAIKQYILDFNAEEALHFPMFTSPSVDLTVTSIFVPLLSGNTIDLYPNELPSLRKIFCESQASLVKLTPTHLKFASVMNLKSTNIQKIIVGGEQLTKSLCDSIRIPGVQIYNEYGPTEATVGCMIYEYSPTDFYQTVPIGKAIDNMGVYLLDTYNQICLPGVEGEIHIAGTGLAEGYMDPDMTSKKFMEIQISENQKYRMYRTGDYGYYLNNGDIVYTGRKDSQRKVRGYRIELEEIEACLLQGLPLQSVYAFIQKDRIFVSVISQENEKDVIKSVMAYAKKTLPMYMVPDKVISLKQMPILISGKVDEAQIVSFAEQTDSQSNDKKIPKDNVTVATIQRIWAEVLNKTDFDVTDSFFDVGGSSILLLELHQKIEKVYPGIELMDYFKYTTINLISEFIDTGLYQETVSDINGLPLHFLTGRARQPDRKTLEIALSNKILSSLDNACNRYEISEVRFLGALLIAIMGSFIQTEYVSVTFFENETEWKPVVPKLTDFERILQLLNENVKLLGEQNLEIKIAVSDKQTEYKVTTVDAAFILDREAQAIILSYDSVYLKDSEIIDKGETFRNILEYID